MLKQAAQLASLEGTEKLGLAGFPPVDSTIAALVKTPPAGGLARDLPCPNTQCRVTETHLKRAYAAEAQPVSEHRLQPTQPAATHGLLRGATSGKAQQAGQGYFGPEKPDGRSPRLPGQTVDSSPCTFPSSTSSTCPDTDPILFIPRRGDERGGPGHSFDCSFLGGGLVGAAGDQEVTHEPQL
ncbi:UNVERIFIED_CONTAM: hypothetical protein FKN15_064807 [Acipenser sinensis]